MSKEEEKEKELALLDNELYENLEELRRSSEKLECASMIRGAEDILRLEYLIRIENDLKRLARANMGIEEWLKKIAGCIGYLSIEESDKIMESVLRKGESKL